MTTQQKLLNASLKNLGRYHPWIRDDIRAEIERTIARCAAQSEILGIDLKELFASERSALQHRLIAIEDRYGHYGKKARSSGEVSPLTPEECEEFDQISSDFLARIPKTDARHDAYVAAIDDALAERRTMGTPFRIALAERVKHIEMFEYD